MRSSRFWLTYQCQSVKEESLSLARIIPLLGAWTPPKHTEGLLHHLLPWMQDEAPLSQG